jgi:hypothetical protein
VKIALRTFEESMKIEHTAPVPVHAPLHPVNVAVLSDIAVNTAVEPALKLAEHDAPQ